MTNVIAKTVYKFWPQWGEDVLAQFKRYDPSGKGYVQRHIFFSSLTSCGLNLSTVVIDKVVKEYGNGMVMLYNKFLGDLEKEVKLLTESNTSGRQTNEKNKSVILGIMDGSVKPSDVRKPAVEPNPIYEIEEEDIDQDVAENQFRLKFKEWVNMIVKTFEENKNRKDVKDMTPDELDRYASLFFILISEEEYKKRNGGALVRELPELMMCIPEWPQLTISFDIFYKVCRRELRDIHNLAQVYKNNALPTKTIHNTMTYQQFSVLACGVSDASISRMIISLKNAPNSSAISSANANTGNGLYSRFNTWKDFTMGFVSGKSLYNGVKASIPTEPDATVMRFVKECVRKDAKVEMYDSEPAMFSVFSELMRNEGLKTREKQKTDEIAHDTNEGEMSDRDLIRSVRLSILEACDNNIDKVYDMLVYAAINNPPFRSDVVTIDAVLRAITTGIGVRLSSQQQAIIARLLREGSKDGTDLMPVRLFMEQFGIGHRGAPTSIPSVITSPEHHGRFIRNAHRESGISSPTIARHVNPEFVARQNNSKGVIDVLEHQNDLPVMSPPKPIQKTGVSESFIPEPLDVKSIPKRERDCVEETLVESEQLFVEKRREFLEKAEKAEEKRRKQGYSDDLYRSEVPPPSRRGFRYSSSSGVQDAMSWNY